MKKIFVITGQTATGKTDYAVHLAKKYDGEIVNADSRQIYKQLDIVTGKDIEKESIFHHIQKLHEFDIGYYEMKSIPLWLYDIVHPKQYFSSFDFQTCALLVIKDIFSRNKTPIIVGGTYFYLKHLLYDIPTESIQPNWELRKELGNKTVSELQNLLKIQNKDIFNQLNESDRSNPQRLIRKIEIGQSIQGAYYFVNNTPEVTTKISRYLDIPSNELEIEIHGCSIEKDQLIERIHTRVDQRLAYGAISEVEKLLQNGFTQDDPGLQTIGYQQLIPYIKKEMALEKAKKEWELKEIQYAKRQLTFMKKDKNILWK